MSDNDFIKSEGSTSEETTTEENTTTPPEEGASSEWFIAEGQAGTGDIPEWFKKDKYKDVFSQAQAYPELEKKLAETDKKKEVPDKYDLSILAEGSALDVESDAFKKWIGMKKENKTTQEEFNNEVVFLNNYLRSLTPNSEEEDNKLGGAELATSKKEAYRATMINIIGKDNFDVLRKSISTAALFNIHCDILKHFKEAPVAPSKTPALSSLSVEEHIAETEKNFERYNKDPIYKEERDRELESIHSLQYNKGK